jgi:hypothetical protein
MVIKVFNFFCEGAHKGKNAWAHLSHKSALVLLSWEKAGSCSQGCWTASAWRSCHLGAIPAPDSNEGLRGCLQKTVHECMAEPSHETPPSKRETAGGALVLWFHAGHGC